MPFNGESHVYQGLAWDYLRILDHISESYPEIQKIKDRCLFYFIQLSHPRARMGTVGIIAAYSRTFCGSCNRIRLTPEGELKTCLYEGGVLNIKDLIRARHQR
jgi:molybdenum cofactor biosynthesis enzyme MoaA